MRIIFLLATFYLLNLISCSAPKQTSFFSKESTKDLNGDCSTKQVGNYVFANSSSGTIGVAIWDNPNKMGTSDYPQSITIDAGSSKTLYDLRPGVYAFEIRPGIYGDKTDEGQFKVEVCKEKTYTYR